jgi:chromosome segregation ATPase
MNWIFILYLILMILWLRSWAAAAKYKQKAERYAVMNEGLNESVRGLRQSLEELYKLREKEKAEVEREKEAFNDENEALAEKNNNLTRINRELSEAVERTKAETRQRLTELSAKNEGLRVRTANYEQQIVTVCTALGVGMPAWYKPDTSTDDDDLENKSIDTLIAEIRRI